MMGISPLSAAQLAIEGYCYKHGILENPEEVMPVDRGRTEGGPLHPRHEMDPVGSLSRLDLPEHDDRSEGRFVFGHTVPRKRYQPDSRQGRSRPAIRAEAGRTCRRFRLVMSRGFSEVVLCRVCRPRGLSLDQPQQLLPIRGLVAGVVLGARRPAERAGRAHSYRVEARKAAQGAVVNAVAGRACRSLMLARKRMA